MDCDLGSNDFTNSKQNEVLGDLIEKINASTGPSMGMTIFMEVIGHVPVVGKIIRPILSLGGKAAEHIKTSISKGNYENGTNLKEQFGQVNYLRDNLLHQLKVTKHKVQQLNQVLSKFEKSTAFNIDSLDLKNGPKELARSILCGFKKPYLPFRARDHFRFDEGISEEDIYDPSCVGKTKVDYNLVRGTINCEMSDAMSEQRVQDQVNAFIAAYARTIAESIILPDTLRTQWQRGNGVTLARFEIKLPKYEVVFKSAGGDELLCALVKDPKYNYHWEDQGGEKVLRSTLMVKDLGLPITIHDSKNKWKYSKLPDGTTWDINLKGSILDNFEKDGPYWKNSTQAKNFFMIHPYLLMTPVNSILPYCRKQI